MSCAWHAACGGICTAPEKRCQAGGIGTAPEKRHKTGGIGTAPEKRRKTGGIGTAPEKQSKTGPRASLHATRTRQPRASMQQPPCNQNWTAPCEHAAAPMHPGLDGPNASMQRCLHAGSPGRCLAFHTRLHTWSEVSLSTLVPTPASTPGARCRYPHWSPRPPLAPSVMPRIQHSSPHPPNPLA
eukprot:366149-Chlamydomonas_euryale.AAC.6